MHRRILRLRIKQAILKAVVGGALITALGWIPSASTESFDQPQKLAQPRPHFVPGEILVRFRSESLAKTAQISLKQLKLNDRPIQMSIEDLDATNVVKGLRVVHVPAAETRSTIDALAARPDVLYAEPNYVRERFIAPNDPLYVNLWALHNTGCAFGLCGYISPGIDVHAERAWNVTTGNRNVVVGIVDGGIDKNHPDLLPNIWVNSGEIDGNGIDDDANGFIDDVSGYDFFHNRAAFFDSGDIESENHATHVAGTIGAVGNNGIGVVGVNWQVSLMCLKIFGRADETPFPSSVAVLVRAYAYAKSMRDLWTSSGGTKGANIRILNNSIGGYGRSQAEFDAVSALNDSGVLFVAAAGNYTRNNDVFPIYPAGYELPNVISVAATSVNFDILANFSNVGARTVTLSAPGQSIQSTTAFGNYATYDGTSMASPHVAGAAALLCAAYPNISVYKLRAALIYNGDYVPSQEYKTLTARRLNAFNSLIAVAENDSTPPSGIDDFRILSKAGRSVTLGWTAPGDDGAIGTATLYDIRYSTSDLSSPQQFETATAISPLGIPTPTAGGSLQSAIVDVPFGQMTGFIGLRATDNMGNRGPIAVVPISLADNVPGQYDVIESATQPLSSGGTALGLFGVGYPDDGYSLDYALPFAFPYFGSWVRNVNVSLNGAIYFSTPPKFLLPPMTGQGGPLDAFSSIRALQSNAMIAGMWDDFYITGGVYAVTPDANRIIFRWEGETFDTPFDDGTTRGKNPIKFEIEMRRDGTIQFRYGDGNQKLFPVVGISGGGPDAYVINSHTSETAFKNLANADTVTFIPHVTPAPSTSDLSVTLLGQTVNADESGGGIVLPAAVVPGQTLQYSVVVTALGPDPADNVVLTSQLPAGTSFVRCLNGSCNGPPPGTDGGTVTVNFGTRGDIYNRRTGGLSVQVVVNAPIGTTLTNRFTVSTSTTDPNLANNTVSATTLVASYNTFGDVIAVDGARLYTLALKQDGSVWLWGIPFGSPESSVYALTTPKRIEGLSNVVAIAASDWHAMALKADGTVWTWGTNESGQLGNGSISFTASPAVQVPGLTNISSIAASLRRSFAVATDGTVWAWGDNSQGQLGDGTTTGRLTPVHLTSISGVRSLAANQYCTYAIKNDGSVWSWGGNDSGLLGTGSSATSSLAPVRIAELTNCRAIATFFLFAAAVQADGSVWVWGNWGGPSGVPRRLNELTQGVGIGMLNLFKLMVLKSDGTVWAWEPNTTPSQIAQLQGVKAIRGWGSSQGAIMSDNSLRMWGYNGYGELGNGGFGGGIEPGPVSWLQVVATPTLNPAGGFSVFPRNVLLSCETAGAVIHYTTNGSDPTESDPIVNTGNNIRIDHTLLLKAKAWKNGWTPSAVVSADYTVLTSPPPNILVEANATNQALALNSVTFVRGPFKVLSDHNFSGDHHTRLIVFTSSLGLTEPDPLVLKVQAGGIDLLIEGVGPLSIAPGLDASYIVVRLPDGLPSGDLPLTITVRGTASSNTPTITIAP